MSTEKTDEKKQEPKEKQKTADEKEQNAEQPQVVKLERKKALKYTAAIDYEKLKSLEGATISNFLELAKQVIKIDGEPYSTTKVKLTTSRKNEFIRLIEDYAVLEFYGIKCRIKMVFTENTLKEINEFQVKKRIKRIKRL